MWRLCLITIILSVFPTVLRAQDPLDWQSCRVEHGVAAPVPRDCRPIHGTIDPQGRELWLSAIVRRPTGEGPTALYVVGTASSEVWLNGQRLGANGTPGHSGATEVPGRYEASLAIPEHLWRSGDSALMIHMSSFHGPVRLDGPIAGIVVAPYPWPSRTVALAIAFIAAGTLFAAAFGFGVIYSLRRTTSSLTLAALAGTAGLQAILESLRALIPYAYPIHGWRLIGIWVLSALFAVLLVSYVVSRFWPQARRPVLTLALVGMVATWLLPGFDAKTVAALMVGLGFSVITAAIGVYRRAPAARATLAYLVVFMAVGALFPAWLVDLSYFLFAAGLILPLLMAEVVRLGRDDQGREDALTQAAARPHCLTVASSRGVERVRLADIVAVVGADDYVELRLADGRQLLHSARLDRLEAELPRPFLRVHRSVIANMDYARGFERDGSQGRLLMHESIPLPISRKRLSAVRDALDETDLFRSTDPVRPV